MPEYDPTVCGCGPAWQKPKPNGTCATCGGWLPWEKPKPLPWTNPSLPSSDHRATPDQPGKGEPT